MTTQEKTLNEQLREVAQKLVDLEINRKDIVDKMSELKENFEQLVEDGADSSIDVNGGLVYVAETIQYKIPEGLKEEILPHVKNPERLSQDIVEEFIKTSPSLNKKGVMAMHEGNVDLANLIIQEEKLSVKIKIS